jgi:LuxR family transcriptional regulator, maltose regulon positive regulatory protein
LSSSGEPRAASPEIVVKPKLRAPSPRPEQLVRPDLLGLLGDGSESRLTLLAAPAGYGKTTLLVQWRQVEEESKPFAWVSLDEQDNDPIRLWRHVVEAVSGVTPEPFGDDVLAGIGAGGRRLIETALPTLINRLAEIPHRIVIVFDDYQFVTEDECNESVAFFLDHLPDNIHLVLSSRTDPHLPVGRLRARGQMNEIRTGQLAFSEEEAAILLNETMRLGICPEDLLLLWNRTEGWPAAIYLAALSLQTREDKHGFIESYGGSSRHIVDLLGEEVLANLSDEERTFLLYTSVLRTMTGPLCDAVVGTTESARILRELSHSNLFVIPLDGRGEWYRYHHLFSDLLLYELKTNRPTMLPVLHGRASIWCESAAYFEAAIRHAVEAADYERAGILVARHWFGYAVAGQLTTVQRWLDALPEDLVDGDGSLLLVKAWISAAAGRRHESECLLREAESLSERGPLPDGTVSLESGVATVRAVFGFDGVQTRVETARRAAELEGEQSSPRSGLLRFALGASLYLSGETAASKKALEEGLGLTEPGQPLLRTVILSFLSLAATDEDRLEEAEMLAREASVLVEQFGLHDVPQSTLASIALGCVLTKRGNLNEAQKELEDALSRRRRLPGLSPWPTLLGLLALASVRLARGDRVGARTVLAEAGSILEDTTDAGIFPERVESLERKLRGSRSRNGQLNGELTEREMDVLRLLSGKLSTREMGLDLYVSVSTVRTHIKSIYRKLGVSARKDAVQEARLRGLV